jgi:beta-lactamase superfamily II metal-dependent hydrolase
LAGLKIAISSARKAKYGHPHIETIWLLKKRGVPLLRTEDWGTIALELRPSDQIQPQLKSNARPESRYTR